MGAELNTRQERFAQFVAAGCSLQDAYEQAGYSCRGASASAKACRLLGEKGKPPTKVAKRVAELQAEANAKVEFSRDDALDMLGRILRSRPEEAAMDNPLCELRMTKAGPVAVFPDKTRCVERMARMLGWDEPERHQLEVEVTIGGDTESQDQD